MAFNRARLGKFTLIWCWLLALATVCGFLASLWWGFELFVHFRLQYCIAGAVLAVALWALKLRAAAGLAAALALANGIPIVPLLLTRAEAAPPASASLRVLAINVFARNRQYDRVIEYVRRERPDVLVLLEVTPEWESALQRQLKPEFAFSWSRATGARAGMSMMSRLPPLESREIDLGGTGDPSLLLTLQRADARITVLGTHLYWPLGPSTAAVRNRQLDGIARAARERHTPLAIVGDLNITPFSPHFARTLRDGGLSSCANGFGLPATWPARFPPLFIQIDHCLMSEGVSARNFRVGPYVGSDHYPVSVELTVSAPSAPAAP